MKALIVKTIVPALIAVSIKIAIQVKEKKTSVVQAIVSFVAGIGFAYILSDYVNVTFSHPWHTMVTAVIAISGEKIGYWIIYKFQPENIFDFLTKKK